MDKHTKEQRSRNMKAIKNKDTKPEIILRKELWNKGYRYRKNYKELPGKPDIVFIKKKVAVFIDGEFWHGYNWEETKKKLDTNREFWIKKIEDNIKRDKKTDKVLSDSGWTVMRIWSEDVLKNTDLCIKSIISALK